MTALNISNLAAGLVVCWLVGVSAACVGYLVTLELQEYRRNRRMAAERERLGLRRA